MQPLRGPAFGVELGSRQAVLELVDVPGLMGGDVEQVLLPAPNVTTLSGVDDPEERAALVVVCVEAYWRSIEPAVGRLLDYADEVGIELEERTLLVRGPER